MSVIIDCLTAVARRNAGLGEDYVMSSMEAVFQHVIVQLRPARSKRAAKVKVIVSDREWYQEQVAWENRTGKCFRCEGRGQELNGWSRAEGQKYKPCTRCGATGLAPLEGRHDSKE